MQLRPHLVEYFPQVFRVVDKIHVIGIDDQQSPLLIISDPVFVALVEPFEVVQAHIALVVAAAVLNVGHQGRNAGPKVDEQVGRLDLGGHGLEKLEVVLKIAGRHQPHVVQVGGEDVGILVDGSVLHDRPVSVEDFEHLLVAAVEEENLEVKRPALHIVVEVTQVGVVVGRFVVDIPTEVLTQLFGEGGFTGADIAGDGDVFDLGYGILLRLAHSIVSLSGTKIYCLRETFKLLRLKFPFLRYTFVKRINQGTHLKIYYEDR